MMKPGIGNILMAIACAASVSGAGNPLSTGVEQMTQVEWLPLQRPEVQVHYLL